MNSQKIKSYIKLDRIENDSLNSQDEMKESVKNQKILKTESEAKK